MKKIIWLFGLVLISFLQINAQSLTFSPGLVVNSPTVGISGLKLNNLTSSSTAATTPTKVLSVDASGNVILSTAPAGGSSIGAAVNVPTYASQTAINAIASPTAGMLVYNSGLNKMVYRTASAWNTFDESLWERRTSNPLSSVYYNGTLKVGTLSGGTEGGTLTIRPILTNFANPHILIKSTLASPTTVMRFQGVPNVSGSITQLMFVNSTAATSSLTWNHITSAGTSTTMATMTGTGNLTVSGFTQMGGSTVPAVKTKVFAGTILTTANTTSVAHGIADATKILALSIVIPITVSGVTTYYYPLDSSAGNHYRVYFTDTNIVIAPAPTQAPPSAPSSPTGGNIFGKSFNIIITYAQ